MKKKITARVKTASKKMSKPVKVQKMSMTMKKGKC